MIPLFENLSNWWKHPVFVAIIVDCLNRSRVRQSTASVVSAVPNSGLGPLLFTAGGPAGLKSTRNASLIEAGFKIPASITERVQ
jgi:hypothetical protein